MPISELQGVLKLVWSMRTYVNLEVARWLPFQIRVGFIVFVSKPFAGVLPLVLLEKRGEFLW